MVRKLFTVAFVAGFLFVAVSVLGQAKGVEDKTSVSEFITKYKDYYVVTKNRMTNGSFKYWVDYYHRRHSYRVHRWNSKWQFHTFIVQRIDPKPCAAYVYIPASMFGAMVGKHSLFCIEYNKAGAGTVLWKADLSEKYRRQMKIVARMENVPDGV